MSVRRHDQRESVGAAPTTAVPAPNPFAGQSNATVARMLGDHAPARISGNALVARAPVDVPETIGTPSPGPTPSASDGGATAQAGPDGMTGQSGPAGDSDAAGQVAGIVRMTEMASQMAQAFPEQRGDQGGGFMQPGNPFYDATHVQPGGGAQGAGQQQDADTDDGAQTAAAGSGAGWW